MNNKLVNFATLLFLAFATCAAVPYGTAPQQTGDLLLPPGEITAATPKILLIHGGGWTSEKYLRGTLTDEAALFRDAGFAVYNIDYRLAHAAAWPLIGDDCLAAAKKLVSCEGMPELAAAAGKPGAIFIDNLPLSDAPMLICDRSAIEFGR